jgi:tRNA1Val (adenine37-N6)-methyltransferase
MTLSKTFPRGLSQPENGFRFSVDSLLLSSFMSPGTGKRIIDLGCGCGVIGLGLILAAPGKNIQVTGLDKCPEMIGHSRKNTGLLGLSTEFSTLNMDVTQVSGSSLKAESYDIAVTNPPYRRLDSGRLPGRESRLKSCFCDETELDGFFKAGAYLIKNKGRIGVVFQADRLDEVMERMKKYSLTPKRVLPVYGNASKPSRIVLIEGIKNAAPGLRLMPPLILYDETGRVTPGALKFCPFLRCNPGRKESG